jgi:predicted glycoside hydrolase/deacetylase ChbG (UPF0249 family)
MATRRQVLAAGAAVVGGWTMMGPGEAAERPTLVERLGHKKDARLLMIHADDVGMCHSVNAVTIRAMTEGLASSASIMVPCPWFPEIAQWAREHPDADLGLHLTLTSEWSVYRWRPVAPIDQVPGLLDPEGFMWRSVEDVKAHASPKEVETEIRAQIERARKFGIKPTHVDSHMGTLFSEPRFFEAYVRVAKETGIFPMLPSPTPEIIAEGKAMDIDYPALASKLESQGFLLLDRLDTGLDAEPYEERKAELQKLIRTLQPGVTELIVHLSGDDDEIHHVTGNWKRRYHDYRLCMDPDIRKLIQDEGVKLTGYRPLAALWAK